MPTKTLDKTDKAPDGEGILGGAEEYADADAPDENPKVVIEGAAGWVKKVEAKTPD